MRKASVKIFVLLTVLALMLSIFTSLGAVPVSAKKKVKLNKTELTLNTLQWQKLKLKHGKFAVEDITWKSSNKAVAKVSKKGWVKGLVRGECTITATIKATGAEYSCKVTVVAPDTKSRVIDPEKPIIALTFDDGPYKHTSRLLDILESYGVTATFFLNNNNWGNNLLSNYSETIRKMYNLGNEVANHTDSHPNLLKLSSSKMDTEINGNADKIRNIIGQDKRVLLRPPYGNYNDTVKSVANTPLIIWSVDSEDWKVSGKSNATESILSMVKKYASDGGIILMHDVHETSVNAVSTVLTWLIQQGYQVCSVSEMFAARGEELIDGEAYTKCSITAEQYKAQKEQ